MERQYMEIEGTWSNVASGLDNYDFPETGNIYLGYMMHSFKMQREMK
jgi:hypothetical protein